MEFQQSIYHSSCREDVDSKCSGKQTFKFYVSNAMNELPKINLIYKNLWEGEIMSEVLVTLNYAKPTEPVEEPTTVNVIEESTTTKEVEEPTTNPTTVEEPTTTKPTITKIIIEPTYTKIVLPTPEPADNGNTSFGGGATDKKEYSLSFSTSGGQEELIVESDSILRINVKTNASTGYSWSIVNEKEIQASEWIEYRGDTYKSDCANPRMKGCSSTRTLIFYIKDATQTLPKIHMVYKRSTLNLGEIVVTLKPEEAQPKEITKQWITSTEEGVKETTTLTVERDLLLHIELLDSTTQGYTWYLGNRKNLQKYYSSLVEIMESDHSEKTDCTEEGNNACPSVQRFTFQIKNDTKQLPKLEFIYSKSKTEKAQQRYTVQLVGAGITNEGDACPVDDYACCSSSKAKVVYSDSLGDWGVENQQWCFILPQQPQSSSSPTCFSEPLGYPCCPPGAKTVYTDEDGDWGVENKKWCGIIV